MKMLPLIRLITASKVYRLMVPIRLGLSMMMALFSSICAAQTLDDYLLLAAENNPALKTYFLRYQAALAQVHQAGNLPDPEITMGVFIQKMQTLMGDQKADVSVMQMFPWFGMLKVQEEEAALMAKAQYEDFRERQNRLFFQVKETYYQLYLLNEKLKWTAESKRILETLEDLALTRFGAGASSEGISNKPSRSAPSSSNETGMGTGMAMGASTLSSAPPKGSSSMSMSAMAGEASGKMSDVLRAQIALKEIDNALAQLSDDKQLLQLKFNLLLHRDPDLEVKLPEKLEEPPLMLSQQALIDSVLHNNPMLKMLEFDGDAAAKQAEMAKLEGRPMIGVGLNYMYYSSRAPLGSVGAHGGNTDYMPGGMGGNMVMPMISMTLPLNRKKYKSMLTSSELMRAANAQQQRAMSNELTLMVEETLREIRMAERNKDLYEDQERLLRQTLDLMVTDYATANGTFEALLDVQQQLLDYNLKKVTNRVAWQTAFARLETLIAGE